MKERRKSYSNRTNEGIINACAMFVVRFTVQKETNEKMVKSLFHQNGNERGKRNKRNSISHTKKVRRQRKNRL